MNSFLAMGIQFLAYAFPLGDELLRRQVKFRGRLGQMTVEVQDVCAGFLSGGFICKITFRLQIEYLFPFCGLLSVKHLLKLIQIPDIKFAFLAFAVGIFGRVKCALG